MSTRTLEGDFLDHLESLRRHLLTAAALFVAFGIAGFLASDLLLAVVRLPAERLGIALYFTRPQEKFLGYIRLALSSSLLVTVPLSLVLLLRFVAPALTTRERRPVMIAAAVMLALYAAGVVFALLVILPVAFAFFAGFRAGDGIRPLWSFAEYLRIVFSLLYTFSLVFESPIVLLLLIRCGLLRIETLCRHRRHAVLLILVGAALVTPPDVVSQLLLAVPLYLLYEGTILAARLWPRHGAKARRKAEEASDG